VGKIAEKEVCRSVFLTIWHCRLDREIERGLWVVEMRVCFINGCSLLSLWLTMVTVVHGDGVRVGDIGRYGQGVTML